MDWKTLLAYITGTVDQELLLRNEYLVTENRILRHGYPLSPGHFVPSMTCREGLTTLPWHGQRGDL
jgi:hypothetical protein